MTRRDNPFKLNAAIWGKAPRQTKASTIRLIRSQLREIAESDTDWQAAKELADVLSIAAKGISALGFSPSETFRKRLLTRHKGNTAAICRKYQWVSI